MEPIKQPEPVAVLPLPELDVELVQALAKYWLVTVEQQNNEVLTKLYPMPSMKEVILTAASILGTLGGWEMIKYLLHRKSNTRKAEAEADGSEFTVLRDTVVFLQEQLQKKEERFAEQTDLVRRLTGENLELTRENSMLKIEIALKLCERRNCAQRQPQSGY